MQTYIRIQCSKTVLWSEISKKFFESGSNLAKCPFSNERAKYLIAKFSPELIRNCFKIQSATKTFFSSPSKVKTPQKTCWFSFSFINLKKKKCNSTKTLAFIVFWTNLKTIKRCPACATLLKADGGRIMFPPCFASSILSSALSPILLIGYALKVKALLILF